MPEKIKCIVWDCDNTLWHGRVAENDTCELREPVKKLLELFDQRGILQSIASRNNHADAMAMCEHHGIDHFFLYPQIHWGSKSESVKAIAEKLNIGLDTFAFVDDEIFEREEVSAACPEVLCIDEQQIITLSDDDRFTPRFITADSHKRRELYQTDFVRQQAEEAFDGPPDAFLKSLDMTLTISRASIADLQRAEELTIRTNQLNTTGIHYSYNELYQLMQSDSHEVIVVSLRDKFGDYGKVGLILLEYGEQQWTIRLLLLSCRIMSRGIGSVLITYLRQAAKMHSVSLYADFKETEKNRMMYMTYKFNGFSEQQDELGGLINDLSHVPEIPMYLHLECEMIFDEKVEEIV